MTFAPGIETFFNSSFKNTLKVAAVTNFTGRDRHGVHLVRRLSEDKRFDLKRIFTPEHGFNSDALDVGLFVGSIEADDFDLQLIVF